MIVSEAHGGPNNSSALSSYDVEENGGLRLITGSAPTNQLAACWVVITQNDKLAFTSDTASGVITGFQVARDGGLTILNAQGVSAKTGLGSTPTDPAQSALSSTLRLRPEGSMSKGSTRPRFLNRGWRIEGSHVLCVYDLACGGGGGG